MFQRPPKSKDIPGSLPGNYPTPSRFPKKTSSLSQVQRHYGLYEFSMYHKCPYLIPPSKSSKTNSTFPSYIKFTLRLPTFNAINQCSSPLLILVLGFFSECFVFARGSAAVIWHILNEGRGIEVRVDGYKYDYHEEEQGQVDRDWGPFIVHVIGEPFGPPDLMHMHVYVR